MKEKIKSIIESYARFWGYHGRSEESTNACVREVMDIYSRKSLADYCTCAEPRPLPMFWIEGQDIVCKCMKVIPKDKLEELKKKLKPKGECQPLRPADWCDADRSNKASMCYDCKLPTKPFKPLLVELLAPIIRVEMVTHDDVMLNRERLNEIITRFGLNK